MVQLPDATQKVFDDLDTKLRHQLRRLNSSDPDVVLEAQFALRTAIDSSPQGPVLVAVLSELASSGSDRTKKAANALIAPSTPDFPDQLVRIEQANVAEKVAWVKRTSLDPVVAANPTFREFAETTRAQAIRNLPNDGSEIRVLMKDLLGPPFNESYGEQSVKEIITHFFPSSSDTHVITDPGALDVLSRRIPYDSPFISGIAVDQVSLAVVEDTWAPSGLQYSAMQKVFFSPKLTEKLCDQDREKLVRLVYFLTNQYLESKITLGRVSQAVSLVGPQAVESSKTSAARADFEKLGDKLEVLIGTPPLVNLAPSDYDSAYALGVLATLSGVHEKNGMGWVDDALSRSKAFEHDGLGKASYVALMRFLQAPFGHHSQRKEILNKIEAEIDGFKLPGVAFRYLDAFL